METLEEIKGLGPKNLKLLNKMNINTLEDLLTFYPFRYEVIKRSNLETINDNDKIIIDGVIEMTPNIFYFSRKKNKMNFKITTNNQIFNIVIFNRDYLKHNLNIGKKITVIGKYDKKHNLITASDIKFGSITKEEIIPIYHTTYGINNKSIKKYIDIILKENIKANNYIPDIYMDKYKLMDKNICINTLHNPSDLKLLNRTINQLKYEELFLFMLKMNYLKNNKNMKIGFKREVDFKLISNFTEHLPFKLTIDQEKSIKEIYDDLISPKRMNRLLQGDVGSGKTIVAFIALYINYLSGYQGALMAPTEILAIQHFNNIKSLFKDLDINVALLTGKIKNKEKKELYSKIASGEIDIIIGTHALFTDSLEYNNLGLVITDEQHRFGVNQRGSLKNKGITPDILYMSATPIPRTYALTLYGDMDISSIKTIPNGKKEIITTLKKNSEIKDVLSKMLEELKNNHQIYVIAPLIEETENSDLENVIELEKKMNKAFGKLYNVGILHGKMSNEEKDEIMNKYRNNDIQILISTTVIEVGVDVPNATMIVIFDSFRFGLSALHQLRGRVGRNNLQSYCILISDKETERLNILTKTNDGFKVSEEDFLMRGSGDLFGYKQSGDMVFKLADLKKDFNILLKAKQDSEEFINNNFFTNLKYKKIYDYVTKVTDLD